MDKLGLKETLRSLSRPNEVRRYGGHVLSKGNHDVLRRALDFKVLKLEEEAVGGQDDMEKAGERTHRTDSTIKEVATDRTKWRNAIYELSKIKNKFGHFS